MKGLAALPLAALLGAGCLSGGAVPGPGEPSAAPGVGEDVAFALLSPLASDREVARRALTPLTFAAVERELASSGKALREEPVDLARQRFHLYVPGGPAPARGFGLLVFVAPWDELTRPKVWRPALDRHRMALVSFADAGNERSLLDRRLPLAILAAVNARARLPVDPARTYMGGFSGGARVAEAAALAYPELFRGALLDAGSDPLDGRNGTYTPPADLFRLFQHTRLVYVTGEHDAVNLHDDEVSRVSMRERCVFGVTSLLAKRLGHVSLDAAALDRALDALDQRTPADPARLEACNARLEREVADRLAEAEAAIEAGDGRRALALVRDLDGRYGGLAAPRIVELEERRKGMR